MNNMVCVIIGEIVRVWCPMVCLLVQYWPYHSLSVIVSRTVTTAGDQVESESLEELLLSTVGLHFVK